ncbi:hypothetical protein GH733_001756 [Mirounga leonina]|nr:hypothetical protein GH733_001756 [Mirounga leonina]
MDNSAFEMHEDAAQNALSMGKMTTISRMEKRQWSLWSVFLMCLLACTLTTAGGVLILSLVYVHSSQQHSQVHLGLEARPLQTMVPIVQKAVDPKFQFLNHLPKSKVFEFPGGAIQWARYRNNVKDYLSVEEEAFGSSLNSQRSQMTLGTLRVKSNGLRAPLWHFNANEHGYLNVGNEDCFFLLFFSTHDELQTLDVDDVFFSVPEDIASRSLKPEGGINFIRTFQKQKEDQAVNLPPNLAELVINPSYVQSPDSLHQNALTLSTLRIYNNGLRQPHFHFNANEMGYVISGCAKGIIEFDVHIGDVVFFPTGTQHYIKSSCDEDLLCLLAFSTGDQATADHILAQLFFKKQSEFKKIPKFKEDQAINLP